jgi:hypothetical protein
VINHQQNNMAAKKNTEGLAFIVETLKHRKAATYAEIKEAAAKKGLTIWPVMFGRAQALLGHVKVAKRGTGKHAQASAAKAGRPMPAMPAKRGPGRPRKNPQPASNGESPRGRQPDATSKSGQVRELLNSGLSPMEIAKKVGCTPGLVYVIKSKIAGGAKTPGRQRKNPLPTTSSPSGLDAFISVMRNSEAQRDRYRGALQKVQGLMQEIQDTLSGALES